MLSEERIQPYSENTFYWQYKRKPVLLIGGSVEDNVFQIPDIESHLDLLASVGGNYVRCTMSSRDEGNVWPFERDSASGLYNLEKPGTEYWSRFDRFLQLASERNIIAQIELWDRFDFARDPWQLNPYNPKNNINYTVEESGLVEDIRSHPGQKESAFFRSLPMLEDNQVVSSYQHAQVDRMLAISLAHGNVLYCIDNETNESPKWGTYWSDYIRNRAAGTGAGVETTEMWDQHDLEGDQHAHTLDHPETYSFVDISQNNHQVGKVHWDNPQTVRQRLIGSGRVCPMNSVKIYGANMGRYGTHRDAQERFWRNILGGLASSRFHRPPSGLGLGLISQAHIRSMRLFQTEFCVFTAAPALALVSNRSVNEAYSASENGNRYAVFFPDGGDVDLEVSHAEDLEVRWLDIRASEWTGEFESIEAAGGRVGLSTPQEEGYWVAVIRRAR